MSKGGTNCICYSISQKDNRPEFHSIKGDLIHTELTSTDKERLYSAARGKANTLNNYSIPVSIQEGRPKGHTGTIRDTFTSNTNHWWNLRRRVRKLPLRINPYKAAGPDEIPAINLRECATDLASLLTMLFRKTLQKCNCPRRLDVGKHISHIQEGQQNCTANHRPVLLTSVCCKTQEHIISGSMASIRASFTGGQHGFSSRCRCVKLRLLLWPMRLPPILTKENGQISSSKTSPRPLPKFLWSLGIDAQLDRGFSLWKDPASSCGWRQIRHSQGDRCCTTRYSTFSGPCYSSFSSPNSPIRSAQELIYLQMTAHREASCERDYQLL